VNTILSLVKKLSCYIVLLTAVLTGLSMAPAVAQKKKKGDGDAVASTRLREAEFYFTEGEKFFILEDYAKALVYYQRALEINPENATIHYKVAEVLASSNKQEDLLRASLSIEQALRLERKNKFFYLLAANIYNNLTRFDKAAQAYESMISEVPGTEEYLYELAVVYQYANKPEEALKVYNRAEGVFGINENASIQKQKILFDQGKTKEGIYEAEKLAKAFPDEERYTVGLAEVLSQQGQGGQAIITLEKYISENKSAPGACMLLAGLYRDTNQEEKARNLLLTVFDDPDVEITSKLIVLGTYNEELNHDKSKNITDKPKQDFALMLFQKLLTAYPQEPNVHILGGDLYLSLTRNTESQAEYLRAIQLGEVNYEVWQNLLYLETQLEQFDNVIKHSEQALEYFPNQSMLYYFNGFAQNRKRRYREAVYSLEQAKKLAGSNAALVSEINSMLGDAYNGTREYDKSDQAYEDALSFNANNDAVLNNYSYYLALRKAHLDKAEKMASQLVRNNPNNVTYLDTYAWVLFAREKYKEAKKVMERVIATGQATATHLDHYGDILFKSGDVDEAVKQWEKARTLLGAANETLNKKIANRKIYE
jgi:tetratricopeptide (TPR) repeat protein